MAGALVIGRVISVRYFAARLGLSLEDFDYSSPASAAAAAIWLALVVVVAGLYGAGLWFSYRLIHWLGVLNPFGLLAVILVPTIAAAFVVGALPIPSPWGQLLISLLTIFVYGFATASLFGPLAETRAASKLFVLLLSVVLLLFGALLVSATQSMIDDAEELADHARALAVVGAVPTEPSSVTGFSLRPVRGVVVDSEGTEYCVVRVTSTVYLTMAESSSDVRTLVTEPSVFLTGWQACGEQD